MKYSASLVLSGLLVKDSDSQEYGTIPAIKSDLKFGDQKKGGSRLFLEQLAAVLVVLVILVGGILARVFIEVETSDDSCATVVCNSTALPAENMSQAATTGLPVPQNHTTERLFGLYR
jgi:hypothetical protein